VYVKANGAITAPEIVEIAAGYDVTVTGAAVGQAWAVARGTTIPDNGAGRASCLLAELKRLVISRKLAPLASLLEIPLSLQSH
jgi:hypothetical protein